MSSPPTTNNNLTSMSSALSSSSLQDNNHNDDDNNNRDDGGGVMAQPSSSAAVVVDDNATASNTATTTTNHENIVESSNSNSNDVNDVSSVDAVVDDDNVDVSSSSSLTNRLYRVIRSMNIFPSTTTSSNNNNNVDNSDPTIIQQQQQQNIRSAAVQQTAETITRIFERFTNPIIGSIPQQQQPSPESTPPSVAVVRTTVRGTNSTTPHHHHHHHQRVPVTITHHHHHHYPNHHHHHHTTAPIVIGPLYTTTIRASSSNPTTNNNNQSTSSSETIGENSNGSVDSSTSSMETLTTTTTTQSNINNNGNGNDAGNDQQQQQPTAQAPRIRAFTMNLTFNIHHRGNNNTGHHHHHLHHHHMNAAGGQEHFGGQGGGAGVGGSQQQQPEAIILDANFLRARQRVYSMLLIRLALLYSMTVPKFVRNLFEYAILLLALICFGLLIHMHVIFIRSPLTCLDHVKQTWPKHGILRVQIGAADDDRQLLQPQHQLNQHLNYKSKFYQNETSIIETMDNIVENELMNDHELYQSHRPRSKIVNQLPMTYEQYQNQYYVMKFDDVTGKYFQRLRDRKHNIHNYDDESSLSPQLSSKDDKFRDDNVDDSRKKFFMNEPTANIDDEDVDESSLATLLNYRKNNVNNGWAEPYIVEYSLEYGLLRLSESMRAHYRVPVMKVMLDPETDKCFGDVMARFMLNNFLGYDDVLIGSIKQLAEHENNRGFVRNVVTGEHFRFVNVWMTRTSYLAAAFIMIIFTLFVSMLIRYSHQQVFVFVSEVLRSLDLQQPATRISFLAASLITVILALIGMETIMYEFFSDSSITFHVIIMVWAADQFDSLAIQSRITRRHFLRFFYLYQFIFYAYHYRFNGQYSGLALLTTMLFTYHSMIYFFHHFELPLLRAAYLQQQPSPPPSPPPPAPPTSQHEDATPTTTDTSTNTTTTEDNNSGHSGDPGQQQTTTTTATTATTGP